MKVGHVGSNANFGYLMDHGITPNGGGKKVNQYTIVYDIHFTGGGGWASLLNMDSQGDGDVFGAATTADLARAVVDTNRMTRNSRSKRANGIGSSSRSTSPKGCTKSTSTGFTTPVRQTPDWTEGNR